MKDLAKRAVLAHLTGAACILLFVAHPNVALSSIYACPNNGTVIYQDRPCPEKKTKAVAKKVSSRYPMNIHESWFDVPVQARERAFCDRRGCECGNLEKKHKGSLVQAVADALYLDGSWHRYELGHTAWLDAPTMSSEFFTAEDEMLEASCEIMMSQVLLRSYANDVLTILHKSVKTAEERGFDTDLPCNQGVAEACAYYDSVQLLVRMKTDAAALQRVRGEDMQSTSAPSLGAALPASTDRGAVNDLARGPELEAEYDPDTGLISSTPADADLLLSSDAQIDSQTDLHVAQPPVRSPKNSPGSKNILRPAYSLNPGSGPSPQIYPTGLFPGVRSGYGYGRNDGSTPISEGRLGLESNKILRRSLGLDTGNVFNTGPNATSWATPPTEQYPKAQ